MSKGVIHKPTVALSKQIPPDMVDYCLMLTWKRRHETESEAEFITRFIDPCLPNLQIDAAGNRFAEVLTPSGERSSMLWSCHLDTMHSSNGRQNISYDPIRDEVFLADKSSNCLGSDDASGIWLLFQLIKAGVPGLYAFHRGEERGGIGSSACTEDDPERFAHIKSAIAFDRRGKTDVVYEQMVGECASLDTAQWIADELNDNIKFHTTFAPSNMGSFTDTANYAGIVAECFNISVGYEAEHSYRELQHLGFLRALRDAVLKINWAELPINRLAGDFGDARSRYNSFYDEDDISLYGAYGKVPGWTRVPDGPAKASNNGMLPSLDEVRRARYARLQREQDDLLDEPIDDSSLESLMEGEEDREAMLNLLLYIAPTWLDFVNANPKHPKITRGWILNAMTSPEEIDASESEWDNPSDQAEADAQTKAVDEQIRKYERKYGDRY